jgi:hypothetical protein
MLLGACLIISRAVGTLACSEVRHPAPNPAGSLRSALAVARLEAPEQAHDALRKQGLSTALEVQWLDSDERREMMSALKTEWAINLGDRAKIRRLGGPKISTQYLANEAEALGFPMRRVQEAVAASSSQETDSVSMDTVALLSTAALGLLSFIVQARVAKAADINQKEIEYSREAAEKQREMAALQVERVRMTIGDAIQPMLGSFNNVATMQTYLWRELFGRDLFGREFSSPLQRWPHAEDYSCEMTPAFLGLAMGGPFIMYR